MGEVSTFREKALLECAHAHMLVCAYFLWGLHLGSYSSLSLETPGFTFPLLPPLHFVGRSRVRKQAPRGFNHFAIKAELLSSLIQAELLEEGLGARLASPPSTPYRAATSDSSRKMEHSSLILPLNQGT